MPPVPLTLHVLKFNATKIVPVNILKIVKNRLK